MKKDNWIGNGLNCIIKETGKAVFVIRWGKMERHIQIVCFYMGLLIKNYVRGG